MPRASCKAWGSVRPKADPVTATDEEIKRIRRLMATDFAAAERAADGLLAERPHDTGALLLRAYLFNFRKDLPQAIELLNQAQRVAPDDAQIAFNRAYLAQQTGTFDTAHALFEKLAAADRDQPDVGLLAALNRLWAGEPPQDRLALAAGTRLSPGGALVAKAISARLGETISANGPAPDAALATGAINFLNRYDVPGWGLLDDKAELWHLAAADAPGLVPETFCAASERGALIAAQGAHPGLWVGKHARLFGGQSLSVSADAAALPLGDGHIVQRYVDDPLLVDGHKFHLRAYVLVGTVRPLTVFVHLDGIARAAPLPWSAAAEEAAIEARHVTNTLRYSADRELRAQARVLSLGRLTGALQREGLAAGGLHDGLIGAGRAVARLIAANDVGLRHVSGNPAAVPPKLLGLDLIFDTSLRAWLLEIERYPALGGGSKEAEAVNTRLFVDMAAWLAGARLPRERWRQVAP